MLKIENISLLESMMAHGEPLHRQISLISETLFFLEDQIRNSDFSSSSLACLHDTLRGFSSVFLDLTECLPGLKLTGNAAFVRGAVEKHQNPADIAFFIARSFDAIRAPLAEPVEPAIDPCLRQALKKVLPLLEKIADEL